METAKKQYKVSRDLGSAGSGCEGTSGYAPFYKNGKEASTTTYGICPEVILGEELGEGSIVEVTVRVVHKVPMPGYCQNPWPAHADFCAEANSKRRLGG